MNNDPSGSLWFQRFMVGLSNRMGQVTYPNMAMSIDLILAFFKNIEHRIMEAQSEEDRHDWIIMTTYCSASYVISLRGNEGLLLDLKSTRENWSSTQKDYFVIGLLGGYKGENHDYTHLVPCINKTASGLNMRNIFLRAIQAKESLGLNNGPLISDSRGILWTSQTIDKMMFEVLKDIFVSDRSLFDVRIKDVKNVQDNYKSYRSFRRSSDTRAINQGVSAVDIDVINRWSTVENSRGKRTGLPMKHHYSELNLLLEPFKRYTRAM